jgi:hypothetical protein
VNAEKVIPDGSDWSSIRQAGMGKYTTSLTVVEILTRLSWLAVHRTRWTMRMCDRTIVTKNKSNRLRDLTKRCGRRQGSQRDDAQTSIIFHPQIYPVESTNLPQRKTEHRNGRTLKTALVAGRYNEQETIRKPLRAGLPKKQMPLRNQRIRRRRHGFME